MKSILITYSELISQELRDRTKKFNVEVIKFCIRSPRCNVPFVLIQQLMSSATSVAANYWATCRGRSRAAFTSKLHIALEEADETGFWLELFD